MKYIKTLLKLKQNRELNYSQIPKALLVDLQKNGLVKIIGIKRKKVIVNQFFDEYYKDIENIENATKRSDLASISHTKAKKISPQSGLYINGVCKIENISLPLISNSVLFLSEIPTIDKNILVVVVENFENVIYIEKQLNYFQKENILFVYRNSKMLEFIEKIENKIIYFGDFDLAGISIYLNEILKRNKNITFFIPNNIENLIKNGSNELYKKQFNKYKTLKSDIKEIQNLIDIIHKYQKTLEQEWFIKN